MKYMTAKEELTELILMLTDEDFENFCSNYKIKDKGRNLLEFIKNEAEDEETMQEIINEIHFNTENEYFELNFKN